MKLKNFALAALCLLTTSCDEYDVMYWAITHAKNIRLDAKAKQRKQETLAKIDSLFKTSFELTGKQKRVLRRDIKNKAGDRYATDFDMIAYVDSLVVSWADSELVEHKAELLKDNENPKQQATETAKNLPK